MDNSNIRIRKATKNDVDAIFAIEQQSEGDWKKEFFHNELKNSFANVWTAEIGNEIAGFAVVWCAADELQLNDIAVNPAFRRQGVASAMLEFITNFRYAVKPKRLVLEVREKNAGAIAFYKVHNFIVTGKRPNYYGNDNALLMEKALA